MHSYDTLSYTIKALLPLVKKMISDVKLDRLRFNVGADGIFISKLMQNGKLLKIEISLSTPNLLEQT